MTQKPTSFYSKAKQTKVEVNYLQGDMRYFKFAYGTFFGHIKIWLLLFSRCSSSHSHDATFADVIGLVVVLVAVCAVVFGSSFYFIHRAPEILFEAAFEGVLIASLFRRSKKIQSEGWRYSNFKRTWKPFAITLVVALIFGFAMKAQCLAATSFADFRTLCWNQNQHKVDKKMKSYYHQHELAYVQIKANGYVGWGNARTIEELGDSKTINYLTDSVSKFFTTCQGKTALDIGCGTGTTAFTLSKLGFDVHAVDISQTAIEMGRELAAQQKLNIQFSVGDVLKLEDLNTKFDLIYDSHCLHCIVLTEDRNRIFAGAKNSLSPGGTFILDTMVMPDEKYDMVKNFEPLRFDENYILWHKTKPSKERGIVEMKGEHWCAQRRIYPADKVLSEVDAAGFKILAQQIDHQFEKPSMLRLVLN